MNNYELSEGIEAVFSVDTLNDLQELLSKLDGSGAYFNGSFETGSRVFDVRYNEDMSEHEIVIRSEREVVIRVI